MFIKAKLRLYFQKYPSLLRHLQYLYCLTAQRDRLMKKRSYGDKNKDTTVFVIRPNAEDGIQGLMSLAIQSLRWIDYATEKGFIPVVDFQNYNTQYKTEGENAWEFFFTQPGPISLQDAYQSKNVILSGNTWGENVRTGLFRGEIFHNSALCRRCYDIIWNHIDFSNEVKSIIFRENSRIHTEDCLGLYIRGTDYVKLKPSGEYVQPPIQDVIEKVREFDIKHGEKNIFLVTEDYDYYENIKSAFSDRVKLVSFDSFIKNYTGDTFLSKSGFLSEDRKARGMDYLVKIALLSKCRYFIGSITMGSIAAYAMNGGKYEDSFAFDLGYYS